MRIAVLLHNHPALLHTLVAGAKLATPVVPLDPEASDAFVERTLRALGCAALITADYRLGEGGLAESGLARVVDRTGVGLLKGERAAGRAMHCARG